MDPFYQLTSVWDVGERPDESSPTTMSTVEAVATHVTTTHSIVALACSNNEIRFLRFNDEFVKEEVTRPWRYKDDPTKSIACMTFSRCGSWLVCALTSGNLEVLPLKLIFGSKPEFVKMQSQTLFSDSDFTSIQCCCRDDCLALPTCAFWYETKKKRPMLIYSNKGGDILFVDMTIRRLSVSLQAPQSIHYLDVVDDFVQNDRFLLVTGFAGSQWLVPLEQNGRSLRETLGRIVPSELRELNVRGSVSSVCSGGTKCIGLLQKDHFLLFNGINFINPVIDIILPENTWTVSFNDLVTFAVFSQSQLAIVVNQCCSNDQNVSVIAKFTHVVGVLPNGRFLGFCQLPTSSKNEMPSSLLVTETSVLCAKPVNRAQNLLRNFFAPKLDLSNAELLCKALNLDFKSSCFESAPFLLEADEAESALELCYLSKIDFVQIVDLFVQKGFSKFILPKIDSWVSRQNSASLNESVKTNLAKVSFNIHLNNTKGSADYERKKAEYDFKEFLSHNLFYEPEECLRLLLKDNLFAVALELVKIHSLQEVLLKELLTVKRWPVTDEFLSLMVSSTNTNLLLDHRSSLCLHFISRLSDVTNEVSKVWLKQILFFFDPSRSEVRRFIEQAKDQTFSVDVENLILEVARFYLSTLIVYLFKHECHQEIRHLDMNLSSFTKEHLTVDDSTVCSTATFAPLACGGDHCCLIANDGIYCWGRNKNGCLGNASLSIEQRYSLPILVSFPVAFHVTVTQVVCGAEHSICLCQNGSVYSWGSNRFGQLGLGDKLHRGRPEVVTTFGSASINVSRLVSGQYHCAAVNDKGTVFGWGWNVHGQVGCKAIDDVLIPKKVDYFSSIFVVDVACGYAHSVFLSKEGKIYVCGNSSFGQLGLNDTKKRCPPCLLPMPEPTDSVVTHIACGYFHNLAFTRNRRLWTWGSTPQSLKFKALLQKRKQQIHQQQLAQNVETLSDVTGRAGLSTVDGSATTTSTNNDNRVTTTDGRHLKPTEIEVAHVTGEIKRICCGYHHNCILTSDGQLYSWGKGLEFQLGHGDKKERLTPTLVTLVGERNVSYVDCGADFTIIVDANGLLSGFGKNDFAQIGFESVPETEKRKLSGKVLTIQRANKSERTIHLPHDGRIYVSKPSRIVGLRVTVSHCDTSVNATNTPYTKKSLLLALRQFDGFYKIDDVERQCVTFGALDVVSFLYFRRGDYVRSAALLFDVLATSDHLEFTEIANVLNFYASVVGKLNVEASAAVLSCCVRKIVEMKPTFDFDAYFGDAVNLWAPALVSLVTKSGDSWPFSLSVKMQAIKTSRALIAEMENRQFVEIRQKVLTNVVGKRPSANGVDEHDQTLVFHFQCGHILTKTDLRDFVTSKFEADDFKSKFPRTADVLKGYANEVDKNLNFCPQCLENVLSKLLHRTVVSTT